MKFLMASCVSNIKMQSFLYCGNSNVFEINSEVKEVLISMKNIFEIYWLIILVLSTIISPIKTNFTLSDFPFKFYIFYINYN